MNDIVIHEASRDDYFSIAELHRLNIKSGFLSSLGSGFLSQLYCFVMQSNKSVCVAAYTNEKIIGFVAGAIDTGEFYREFIRNNIIKCTVMLLPRVLNLNTALKIGETLSYPLRNRYSSPKAELLSIVVDKNYRRKNIGARLFQGLADEFKKRKVSEFKAVVGCDLSRACKFYERMGGAIHAEIEVHKGEISREYLWKV